MANGRELRLGVNIDHVATLRNARGGTGPDPVRAALLIEQAGGQGVTAHLREDRRHIRDSDVERISRECPLPLNFEMATTEEMVAIATRIVPNACCLVPERREERTTEHGLDVISHTARLREVIKRLQGSGIRVSLFVDPVKAQLAAAADCGADIVELHTGTYCEASGDAQHVELNKLVASATTAHGLGLEVHAGHGLDCATVKPVAAITEVVELNIGHALIADAVFDGFETAVRRMRTLMDEAMEEALRA